MDYVSPYLSPGSSIDTELYIYIYFYFYRYHPWLWTEPSLLTLSPYMLWYNWWCDFLLAENESKHVSQSRSFLAFFFFFVSNDSQVFSSISSIIFQVTFLGTPKTFFLCLVGSDILCRSHYLNVFLDLPISLLGGVESPTLETTALHHCE